MPRLDPGSSRKPAYPKKGVGKKMKGRAPGVGRRAGKRVGIDITEDSPRWNGRTMGNKTQGTVARHKRGGTWY